MKLHMVMLLALALAGCPSAEAPGGHEGGHEEPHADGDEGDHKDHPEDPGGQAEHEEGVVQLDPASAAAAGIRTEAAARRALLPELRTTGRVDFDENRLAHVGPRTQGRVTAVLADLGAKLTAGQTVAVLESVELGRARADYLSARATREVAEAVNTREQALLDEKISSEAEVLASRAAFQQAQAHQSAAAETLRVLGLATSEIQGLAFGEGTPGSLSLKAPFAGTLVERHLQRGEFVSPQDTLFTVADLSSLWVWIDVYERDLSRVHLGDEARMEVQAWPGRSWSGKVTYLRDVVDPESRTVRARIEVANPDGALRPAMFATVQLLDPHHEDADAAEVLAVPDSAVQRLGDGAAVYVQEAPGRFVQRAVILGHRSGGWAEVLSGLTEGELVAVSGAFVLKTEAARESLGGGHTH